MGDMGDPSSISNDTFGSDPMGDDMNNTPMGDEDINNNDPMGGDDMDNNDPMGNNNMDNDDPMGGDESNDMGEDDMNNDPMNGDDTMGDDMDDEAPTDPGSSVGVDQKKNLQKLAGRLSNSIKDYNNENEKMDTETNKYITNMVIGQTVKGMEEEDIQDVIDKLSSGEQIDGVELNDPEDEETNELDAEVDNEIDNQIGGMSESRNRLVTVNEIFNDLKKFHEQEPIDTVPENDYNYNKKPFIPNNF